jgi:hypothetical protein
MEQHVQRPTGKSRVHSGKQVTWVSSSERDKLEHEQGPDRDRDHRAKCTSTPESNGKAYTREGLGQVLSF